MEPLTLIKTVLLMIGAIEVPGLLISYVLLPKADLVERLGFGFIFGLIPSFLLYAMNKVLHIPITPELAAGVIIMLSFISFGIITIRKQEEAESG